ncbi:MAG: outer membrane protein assembly factor BamB [Limisphaerales bacterium]|jgi:outer membrane protein assembly factor BamB
MKHYLSLLTLAGLMAGLFPTSGAAPLATTDWPQWRGPNRDGHVNPGAQWPDSLNSLRQVWSIKLGPSYSGPIVAGNRIFTTETVDKKDERVSAFDRTTGKRLWQRDWKGAMKVPFFAASNGSWIRSTPATDGKSLFVGGIKDVLVSLNAETGEQNWRIDFPEKLEAAVPSFGMACSPLIDGDHVYVQAGAGFCKVDKRTGQIVWRVAQDKGGMFGSAFSSPVKTRLAGKEVFLVQTRVALNVIDLQTGNIDCTVPIKAFRGMNILTPLVHEGSVFTSAYGGRSHMFNAVMQSGKVALSETWNAKHQGYMSSPIVVGGVCYHHLRNQRLVALDISTGKDLWDVSNRFGKYWSMAVNGERILALDQKGKLHLIRANREKFDQLDTREIGDNAWAHLAVSGNQVVIRELNELAVYEWSPVGTVTAMAR